MPCTGLEMCSLAWVYECVMMCMRATTHTYAEGTHTHTHTRVQEATTLAIRCIGRSKERGMSRHGACRVAASVLTKVYGAPHLSAHTFTSYEHASQLYVCMWCACVCVCVCGVCVCVKRGSLCAQCGSLAYIGSCELLCSC